MMHPVEGIDHIVLLASSLDGATERFRRLRFTLSSRGPHGAHTGTTNDTIVFEKDISTCWRRHKS